MRRLILLCSAAGAVAMAGSARAEGPYVAAEGGVYLQRPLAYNFVGLSDFFSTKYAKGYDVAGKLGYDFEGIRIEAELGYKRAKADEFGFQINGQALAVQRGAGVSGNLNTLSAMANIYWDITQKRFRPYIGGGVGIARVTSDRVGYAGVGAPGIFLNTADTALAFQLMAGVKARVTPHVSANIGYKYFDVEKYKLKVFNTTASSSIHSSTILAGISYSFGRSLADTPPPPTPPAALPPAPDAAAPVAEAPPVQTIFSVAFAPRSTALPVGADMTLDEIVTAYRQVGHASVMVAGASTDTSLAVYNEALAQRRAMIIVTGLVHKGVARGGIGVGSSARAPGAAGAPDTGGTVDITFGPGSGQ